MEPKDYVLRLIKKMIQFLARIHRLLDEKQFKKVEQATTEQIIELTGLPEELIELGDPAVLEHMTTCRVHDDEYLLLTARLFYLKGLARSDNGDPITAYRYFQCAQSFCGKVSSDSLGEDMTEMLEQLRSDLKAKLVGVVL